jgi:oxygen-independent coproporphyrinogen-3 oxidase
MHRVEPFELATPDGHTLRGEIVTPSTARAVCVVGHAMMVDRRTLDRPRGAGLVTHLASRGLAVIWPDLRGHGESGPTASDGGDWSYDDLVADVPHLFAFARARFPGLRLCALGHSLFSHVTLAHLGRQPNERLDALATLACNVSNPTWRRRPLALAAKRAGIATMHLLTRATGGTLPVRRLGYGTADESRSYVEDMFRHARTLDWSARDGWSYFDALPRIRTPLLAIASTGDRFYAPPADVIDLARQVPGARTFVVGRAGGFPFDPNHMGLVTDNRSLPVWDFAADFLLG